MTNKGNAWLLLSWLCFVAIPMVNAQHYGGDHHWVRLCTSTGIVLIAADAAESGTPDDHGIHCPCAQNLFIAIAPRMPALNHGRSILNFESDLSRPLATSLYAYQPRAPPTLISPIVPVSPLKRI